MSKETKRFYEFGPYRIDTVNRRLMRGEEVVPLKAKAVDTLIYLIERGGDVVEKEELMKTLWPDSFVEEANLTQNIYMLRKALGGGAYIETIPRRGYRFIAQVKQSEDVAPDLIFIKEKTRLSYEEEYESDSPDIGSEAEDKRQGIIDITPRQTPLLTTGEATSRLKRRTWFAIAGLLGVALLVGLVLWLRNSGPPFQTAKLAKFTTTGKAIKAAISGDGKYVVYVLSDTGQQSVWLRQMVTGIELQIVAPLRTDYYGLTFSRDGNFIYYVNQDQNQLAVLYQVPTLGGTPDKLIEDVDSPVTLSPDDKQLAFIRFSPGTASVVIANANGSGERVLATTHTGDAMRIGPNGVLPPSWSPDGNIIACPVSINSSRWDQSIYGFRVKDGAGQELTKNHWPALGRIEWLPNGSGLLATIIETETTPDQQIWFVPYPKGDARRITNDLTDYRDLSVTADGRTIITIQSEKKGNIWLASTSDLDHPTQLTVTSYDGLNGLSWTPDGRLVYTSLIAGEQNLWVTSLNGGNAKQLTAHAGFSEQPAVSPDGRYIVLLSNRNGQEQLWRIDIDGRNPLQLTHGTADTQPTFTADGQWVIYRSGSPASLLRVSINGGEPVLLTDRGFDPNVSPDGKTIALGYRATPAGKNTIAILPVDGGTPKSIGDWRAEYGRLRWAPDGSAIAYAARQEGVGNIWVQPLDGSAPRQLTHWNPGPIWSFDWSRDGKWLAYTSGSLTSDVVVINDVRR